MEELINTGEGLDDFLTHMYKSLRKRGYDSEGRDRSGDDRIASISLTCGSAT